MMLDELELHIVRMCLLYRREQLTGLMNDSGTNLQATMRNELAGIGEILQRIDEPTQDSEPLAPITDEEWSKDRGKKTSIGQANAILKERQEDS
jgi:hypothetical protein